MSKSTSNKDRVATTAHLIETTGHHLAHTTRHVEQLAQSKTKKQRDFNLEHIKTHLAGGVEHVQKLMNHVKTNYPAEGKELSNLENTVPHTVKGRMQQAVQKHKGK